jgi:acyl-[acyl-carrier-protein]-phospholipid O-acyltransferase/long-chain-fatty-acid--[acyl-carrier-protein] ligase
MRMGLAAIAATPEDAVVPCDFSKARKALFHALIDAQHRFGAGTPILVDGDERVLSYGEIVRGALALGRALRKGTAPGETVGILLPTSAGAVVAFFALSAYGRIPALLNFTAGAAGLRSALCTAVVKRVLTSRRFVEVAKLDGLIAELSDIVEIVYLEDIRESLGAADKIAAVIGQYLPKLVAAQPQPDAPAAILFTSGTEGLPKGVALSHHNMLANVLQMQSHVLLTTRDVLFNPLPVFHSMGLTAGTILPLMIGMKVVLHPTPLQPHEIANRIRAAAATILLSTDTFVSQYARAGQPGDLNSLRFAVCGAERLRDETRELMRSKYGVELMEGYGVSEASPVVAVNKIGVTRPGAVGRLVQGMEARIEPVAGIDGAGRLLLRGPNIMLGYVKPEQPGVIHPPPGGWHDTGDVVSIDDDGTIAVQGRLRRFAKIAGEAVSLAIVERGAAALWPDHGHAAVAVPDGRRGEQIVLVTTCDRAACSALALWARGHGLPDLAVPRRIVVVDEIPVLGSGKTAYALVQQRAEAGVVDAAR